MQKSRTESFPAEFRLVVFRPFKGEVIMGRISRCSPEGIHGTQFDPTPFPFPVSVSTL